MIDLLKQAVEQAAQLPEDEQQRTAALIFAEIDPEKRWEELLNDPRSEAVLEELVTRAKQQKPLPFPQPRGEDVSRATATAGKFTGFGLVLIESMRN